MDIPADISRLIFQEMDPVWADAFEAAPAVAEDLTSQLVEKVNDFVYKCSAKFCLYPAQLQHVESRPPYTTTLRVWCCGRGMTTSAYWNSSSPQRQSAHRAALAASQIG